MVYKSNFLLLFKSDLFPLSTVFSIFSRERRGLVNSKDDCARPFVGKFNCHTGAFQLSKEDKIVELVVLQKNKWHSK